MLTTWIVTPDGKPRRELLSFLKSIPDLELLNAPGAGLSTAALAADESRAVDLLIFDIYSRDYDNWAEVRAIKAQLPRACCITPVSTPRQMALAVLFWPQA